MARDYRTSGNRVVVIGLGRFGGAIALALTRQRLDVLALDSDPKLVDRFADDVAHAAIVDATDEAALRQLGVHEFRRAVVGIGTDVEASILTTSILANLGIRTIWAKAISKQHARILQRVGAHHVVQPEFESGERVAHLLKGRRMLDYMEFDDNYAIVKTGVPNEAIGRPLKTSQLRAKYGVTVVSIKRPGQGFTYATEETIVNRGDLLIVAGTSKDTERFASLT